MSDTWEKVLEALEQLKLELDGKWPVPYVRPRAHMFGYSRARGRRAILLIADSGE